MNPRRLSPVFALPLLLACACSPPAAPDEPADDRSGSFPDGKADGDACASDGSAAARGILALVNDDATTAELLDLSASEGGVGLHRTAAHNIAGARPFASMRELDDVPFVGAGSCAALQRHACEVAELCDRPLSVMTWNVEHFPLTGQTAGHVASIVHDAGADIVGFQEIKDVDALFELADSLSDYEAFVAPPGPFTRVGALVRLSAGRVQSVEELFVGDSHAFPRPPLSMSIELRTALGPRRVTFTVVHLKARLDPDSQQRRLDAVTALDSWLDEQAAAGRDRNIVLGDFNDKLTDPEPFNVFEPMLARPDDYAFLTAELAESGAFSFVPFESMIDHVIATSPVLSVFDQASANVLQPPAHIDDFEHEVSDHLPVVVELATH